MTPTTTDVTTRSISILERSVCMVLHCGYLGNSRKVYLEGVDMEKDGKTLTGEKDELGATKRLFASKDLRPCTKIISSVKNKLRSMSLGGGERMFGDGAYLIPLEFVAEARETIRTGRESLTTNIESLVAKLPTLIEERRQKLGPLFDLSQYPTADQIRAAYRISYNFMSFGAPDRLVDVDVAIAEEAQAEWNERLSNAYEDVVLGLRESAASVMHELANRLGAGDDGELRALRGTALRDVNDLLERLPILNSIGDDDELAGKLARVGVYLKGVDVDMLRKAPSVRESLQKLAEQTAKQLDELVTTGKRAISFEPLGSL